MCRGVEPPHLERLLEEHRERGDGGVEEGEAAARDEGGCGERDEEQHAEAAAHAAARVHEHDDADHVHAHARRDLQGDPRLAQPREREQRERHQRVNEKRRHHRAGRDDTDVEDTVQERECPADEDGEHDAVDAEDREGAPCDRVGLGERRRSRCARRIGSQHLLRGGAHS